MPRPARFPVFGVFAVFAALVMTVAAPVFASSAAVGTAQVRQVPAINGGATVEGSIHMMTGGTVNLNGGATITGDLLVPGTPTIRINGNPTYAGTQDGSGPTLPTNYTITLNGNASLRHVIRRTAPLVLAPVSAPPAPAGTRSVNLNNAGQSVGAWNTLRNLTLNGNVGQVAVPPGTYGDFTANGGSGFTFGTAGATQPSVYNFQRFNLNGQAKIQVLGPVVINLANGFSANGQVGATARPDWLTLNVTTGSFNLNGGSSLYAFLNAPASSVIINGNSRLVGGLIANSLIVNGGGLLRLEQGGGGGPVNTAPVATAQSVTTAEDIARAITLAAADAEGDALTYTVVTPPAHGTLSGNAPALTYTPTANFNGADSFTFKARDASADSNVATISFTVTPVNDAPSAAPVAATTPEDTAVAITLLGTDIDSSGLTYAAQITPIPGDDQGTVVITGATATYTPPANQSGTFTFTYIATDNGTPGSPGSSLSSAPATVTVSVTPVNDAPVANPDTVELDEDTSLAIVLSATDLDGVVVVYTVTTPPAHGTLTIAGNLANYTPAANYHGTDRFEFIASDDAAPSLASSPAAISILVRPVNDMPVATPLAVLTVPEDTTLGFVLEGTDVDGDALTYTLTTPPTHGALTLFDGSPLVPDSLLPVSGALLHYTPVTDYHGPDGFTFIVQDASSSSLPVSAVIDVTPVNDLPAAQGAAYTVSEGETLPLVLVATDTDGDALTYAITSVPAHGALTLSDGSPLPPLGSPLPASGPALLYTPPADLDTTVEFTFTASDAFGVSPPATVMIEVRNIPEAPVAHAQSLPLAEDTSLTLTLAATDPENDPLTYSVVVLPVHGTLTLPDGSPLPPSGSPLPAPGSSLLYTPNANYHGPDAFSFVARDATLESAPAVVSLDLTPVNDAPLAAPLAVRTDEDVPLVIALSATDADGDTLTYTIVTPPVFGSLTLAPDASATEPRYLYTPNVNAHGFDGFTFTATDPSGAVSASAAVSLEVVAVNDVPVALTQSFAITEGAVLALTLAATDVDGDSLGYALISLPTLGTLTLADGSPLPPLGSPLPAPGSLLYTPPANTDATATFAFTATDPSGAVSAPALLTLAISNRNDAPLAIPAGATLVEDDTIVIPLAATDPDGVATVLTYTISTPPAHGTVTLAGNLATYTPAPNYHGPDAFAFVATDDGTPALASAPAEVSLTITPVNDAPVAQAPLGLTTAEEVTLPVTLVGTDVDGDALTYTLVNLPAHGTLTLADGSPLPSLGSSLPAPGSLLYTPAVDYHGPDSFTFTVSDSSVASVPSVVQIQVTPVNDRPVSQAADYTVDEGQTLPFALVATDVDGDTLAYTVTASPALGSLTLADGSPLPPLGSPLPAPGPALLLYTPPANIDATVTLTFTAADVALTSEPAVVTIHVVNRPDAPAAQAQALTLPEDGALPLTLSATDPDGDALTYAILTLPTHGVLTYADGSPLPPSGSSLSAPAPALLYTPAADYHGADAFTFAARDAALESAPAVVSFTVTPVNDAPVALSLTLSVAEGATLPITLQATDVDGDALSYSLVALPAEGSLTYADGTPLPPLGSPLLAPGSPLLYTPPADSQSSYVLVFSVTDATAPPVEATITIQVIGSNDAPTAAAQSLVTPEDTALALTLTGADPENAPLSFRVINLPAHGTLTLADGSPLPASGLLPPGSPSASSSALLYTPAADYAGPDAFAFTVSDPQGATSAPASVTLAVTPVNDPPVTTDQALPLVEDTAGSILLQATDADADPLAFSLASAAGNTVTAWNDLALAAVRQASRPVASGGVGATPPDISRALAIVQLAVFDAVNAIDRAYAPYAAPYLEPAGAVSPELAAAQAAHDALHALFPLSRPLFAARLAADLAAVYDSALRDRSAILGAAAAARILALRANDGADASSTYQPLPPGTPGAWQPADSTLWGTPNGGALHPEWGAVTPFVLASSTQFAVPPPPPVGSPAYAAAYAEVKLLGASTSPVRNADQTETSYYWADGPGTVSPPGHWNAIAARVAARSDLSLVATARLLALVNLANADAAIACWHSKFVHDFWRPVTAIRFPDDGDPFTEADPVWSPLLGTPQFPSYVSGHSTFSSASAAVLAAELGDAVRITVPSEDARASARVINRLSVAALEAGRSRIFGGIHYEFDNVAGRELGRSIAAYVVANALLPVAPLAPASIQRGEASLDGATLVYTPPTDYHGPDSVPFTVSDGQATAGARVLVTLAPRNDIPVAQAQAISLAEDTQTDLTLDAYDADGDALTFTLATIPAHGVLTYADGSSLPAPGVALSAPAASLRYTPEANFNGADSFSFTVSDAVSTSAPAAVNLVVVAVNDAPAATPQALATPHHTPLVITLSGTDLDLDVLAYTIVIRPAHGTLTLANGAALPSSGWTLSSALLYRPSYGFWGQDSFSFTARDGVLTSAPASVAITVTAPIVAVAPIVSLAPIVPAPLPETAFALRATAQDADGTVARVEFYEGATLLDTVTTPEPGEPTLFTLLLSSGRPPGTFTFTAKVYDNQGLSAVSVPLELALARDPRAHTFTTTPDFEEGEIRTLLTDSDQLTTSFSPSVYDFVWVANSSKGTVVLLDSETARVLAEFRSAPGTASSFPSRIAIDTEGNAFVANRQTGSVVKIGLGIENGAWEDRDGDGVLTSSTGLDELLPWPVGGTPVDERILLSIETGVEGLDHIALDADDNVWVGYYSGLWELYDGRNGSFLRSEAGAPGRGGRGGYINADGLQVSSGHEFLHWNVSQPIVPPDSIDTAFAEEVRDDTWGVVEDFAGDFWITQDWSGLIEKHDPSGALLGSFYHGEPWAQGVTVGKDGHIWVAHSHCGRTVGHLLPSGAFIGNVPVAEHGPTEVAADRRGRIWVVSTTGVVERINPLGGPIGKDGVTPVGEVELSSPNLGGTLWTFGNFVGNRANLFLQDGEWRFAYDGQIAGSFWGPVHWNALLYNDAAILVEVALSEDGVDFGPWQTLTLDAPVPVGTGRYLTGRVTFTPAGTGESPTLYDLTVGTLGYAASEPPRYWRVSAGAELKANWPDTIQLKGAFGRSDHIFPNRPTYEWSLVSFTPFPPGTTGTAPAGGVPTFRDPTDPRTTVTFNGVGDYVLRLTATLDGVVSTDEVLVHVVPFNKTPYVSAGEHVFLRDAVDSVTLAGTVRDDGLPYPANVSVQWEKLFGPGAVTFTAPTAVVTEATFSAPGIYVLRLTADDGEHQQSSNVTAWVGLVCRPLVPGGLVSWWQGNGDGADHIGGNQAFLESGAKFAEGQVGPAFDFDGINDRLLMFGNPSLDVGQGDGFTLEFWVRPTATRTATILQFGRAGSTGLTISQRNASLDVDFRETSGVSHLVTISSALPLNTWTHLAVTYDRASGRGRIYRNGAATSPALPLLPGLTIDTRRNLRIGGNWAGSAPFQGQVDELSLYRTELRHPDVFAVYTAASSGKRPPTSNAAPTVVAGPAGGYVLLGSARTLTLAGSVTDDDLPFGSGLNRRWTLVSAPLPTATASFVDPTSPTTSVTFSDPGLYTLQLDAEDGAYCTRATAEVRVAASAAATPSGLVAWWPANHANREVVRSRDEFGVNVAYGPGQVGGAYSFTGGTSTTNQYMLVPKTTGQTNLGDFPAGFTIELWYRNGVDDGNGRRVITWSDGVNELARIYRASDQLHLNIGSLASVANISPAQGWIHAVWTFDRAAKMIRSYRNGVLQGLYGPMADVQLATLHDLFANDLYLGSLPFETNVLKWPANDLDELSFYDRPLGQDEVLGLYAASAQGKQPPSANLPPVVSAGLDQVVSTPGGSALLQGTVSDDALPANQLEIQWTQLSGPSSATLAAPTLAQSSATFPVAGIYCFQLTARDGLVTRSDTVEVRVAAGLPLSIPAGLVAWWPGNGDNREVVRDRAETGVNLDYASGKVGAAYAFDGATQQHVFVPRQEGQTNLGDFSAGFTIEFWFRNSTTAATGRRVLIWSEGVGSGANAFARIHRNTNDLVFQGLGSAVRVISGVTPALGWVHVAWTYDGTTGVVRTYRNGVLQQTHAPLPAAQMAALPGFFAQNLYIGGLQNSPANLLPAHDLDELSFYNRPLTQPELLAIHTASAAGKNPADLNAPRPSS